MPAAPPDRVSARRRTSRQRWAGLNLAALCPHRLGRQPGEPQAWSAADGEADVGRRLEVEAEAAGVAGEDHAGDGAVGEGAEEGVRRRSFRCSRWRESSLCY